MSEKKPKHIDECYLFDNRFVTIKEDVTAHGNRFYIQLEDTVYNDNSDFKFLLNKEFKAQIIISKKD